MGINSAAGSSESRQSASLAGIEALMLEIPQKYEVTKWRVENIDIWPLFATSLVGLALHFHINFRRGRIKVGGVIWKTGVIADYFAISRAKALFKTSGKTKTYLPPDDLANKILMVGSRDHSRHTGGIFLVPPLDVPAIALRRTGRETVFWLIDAPGNDPCLEKALNTPMHGTGALLREARGSYFCKQTLENLGKLPGFHMAMREVSSFFPLSIFYLKTWFARQVDLAASATGVYGRVLDKISPPSAIMLLSSGYWWSTGLAVAAHQRSIPVLEMEHGAERASAITGAAHKIHFSRFNSAPTAVISWSQKPGNDPRILAAGPVGNILPALLKQKHPQDLPAYDTLRALISQQENQLERHAGSRRFEILISSEAGVGYDWIVELAAQLPPDIFCWIRRHPAEADKPASVLNKLDAGRFDTDLASEFLLPVLLARTDLHVTRFSALTLEAAAMGVPTLATQSYAQALYREKVPRRLLTIETKPDLAVKKIIALSKDKNKKPSYSSPADMVDLAGFIERHANWSKRLNKDKNHDRG